MEVEEVSKEMVVYWWVVVVEANAVKNVDWELTRGSVWQWSDVDVNVYGCEVGTCWNCGVVNEVDE